ncbi:hypothetical protein ABH903_003464 [Brevibacterium epidermidis]|jgi:hypothetical protein|uniref:Tyr recombinase domain-containing protein n=1 Tax=Brevibacterium epidermidis TaxID=1698 RepID=A0ABV4EPH2_BREEP
MNTPTPQHTADGARRQEDGLVDQWTGLLDDYEARVLRFRHPRGIDDRDSVLRRLASRFELPPETMTADHLIETLGSIKSPPGAKNYLIMSVRGLFSWAYRTHRTSSNPAVSLPTVPEHSPVDVIAVAGHLRRWLPLGSERQRLILLLASCAGLTAYEQTRLRTTNIDADLCTITTATVGAPRIIPVHPALIDELARLPAGWVLPSNNSNDYSIKPSTIRSTAVRCLPPSFNLDTLVTAYVQDFYTATPRLPTMLLTEGTP